MKTRLFVQVPGDHIGAIIALVKSGKLAHHDVITVDFTGEDLRGIDLCGQDLSGLDFSGADLMCGDFSGAIFSGSSLFGANLGYASLQHAALINADLREAELIATDLSGAQLAGADLKGAVYDRFTQWPSGFRPRRAGAIPQWLHKLRLRWNTFLVMSYIVDVIELFHKRRRRQR